MIEDLLWTEKYRPSDLDSMALTSGNRTLLEEYLAGGEIPHLLLIGAPGCGKTTLAKILIQELDCTSMTLNASNERGIDVVRERVSTFARTHTDTRWNIVFLDEFDSMTRDAQQALRNMMETYSSVARFILTGNFGHRVLDAIASRCTQLDLQQLEPRDRYKVLVHVLDNEGIEYEPAVALEYAKQFTDLRKLLSGAQRAVLSSGEMELPPLNETVLTGDEIWAAVEAGDWNKVIELSQHPAFDHQHALTQLFWAVPETNPERAQLRFDLGRAVHESAVTPDPVVHFLGTCAGLMK